jgi:DNA-binding transcriptional LysR family regulator
MIPEQQPALTLRQAWHFVLAAESGTLAEAARRLHMAPSAISTSIGELERAVGAELLVKRRAKGVALTATGRQVLGMARELLRLADSIAALSREDRSQLRGPLTVGCDITLGPTIIPAMLTDFARQCPGVEVDFVEGFHEDVQAGLLAGALDVAFVYDAGVDPALTTVALADAAPHVLVPADHPLAEAEGVWLTDIAHEPLVLFDSPPLGSRVLQLLHDAGAVPQVRHRSRSYATVRSLVAVGRGVAVLYQQTALEAPYAELGVRLLPLRARAELSRPVQVALASPRSTRPSVRARAWIDVALELFTERGGD